MRRSTRITTSLFSLVLVPSLLAAGEPGKMKREIWTGLEGSTIVGLTGSAKYFDTADVVETISGSQAPTNWGNNYGQRLRAYIIAPESGDYTFWIAGDGHCELYLSTDESKFNKSRIAYVHGWTSSQQWDKYTTQRSALVTLVAGQKYFIEALHKEGGGGDNLAIAWKTPTGQQELIPAAALESFTVDADDADDDGLKDSFEAAHGLSTTDNGSVNGDNGPLGDPDKDGYINLEEQEFGTNPTVHGGVPGYLSYDKWNTSHGWSIADLKSLPKFHETPDAQELVAAAESPVNSANYYGARLSGYIIAPVSGDYTFWEAGDDRAELWLSTDSSKFNKQRIAWHKGYTAHRQWDKFPTQTSATITLVAGQKYYIEALVKEWAGADHLSIAWQVPGGQREVIPVSAIESTALDADDLDNDGLKDSWETANGLDATTGAGNDGPLGDPDEDYAPNWLEHAAGTDPQSVDNSVPGALVYEEWCGISGRFVKDLKKSSKFLQSPDQRYAVVTGTAPSNNIGNIGNRIRGYITAPTTGDYTFWAEGNKEVELWLSTDDDKFNKELLVRTVHFTAPFNFDFDIAQKSKTVHLVAGQKYYLECYHKINNKTGNHFNIAWQTPGGQREELPASVLSTFHRQANDLDGDDLRDDYELANGLDSNDNGSANPANGAYGDLDGDGLLNHEEQTHGTAANLADTDGDGVNDHDEITLLETQALVGDVAPFQIVQTVNGSSHTSHSGAFANHGNLTYTTSARGWVEYSVNVPNDGTYLLDLSFGPRIGGTLSDEYETVFSIDGQHLGRVHNTIAEGATANAKILTPWLTTGNHTVRILVDNSLTYRRVDLHNLTLLSAHGSDDNANGTPDWVENRLAQLNGIDTGIVQSQISPLTLEGRARYIDAFQAPGLALQPSPGDRWFADVTLDASGQPTSKSFSFENGGLVVDRQLTWVPTNLLTQQTISLRQGDSLRLSSWDGATASGTFTATLSTTPIAGPFLAKETPGHLPTDSSSAILGWSNQSLADLLEARGVMQGNWISATNATAHHIVINGSTATLQLQFVDGIYTKVTKIQLTQSGNDIVAHQIYAKYKVGDHLGEDFDVITATNAPAGSGGYGVSGLELTFYSVSPSTTDLTPAAGQPADQPIAVAFDVPGTHTITATWTSADGTSTHDSSMTVKVTANIPTVQSPICVSGFWREWDVPSLPEGTVLELDDRIEVRETIDLGESGTRYIIKGETPEDTRALVRVEETGAVLGAITLRGMRVRDNELTSVQFIQSYNDGSYLVEMPAVIDGMHTDATLRYNIFIGGVTFEDGSIQKDIIFPGDCDAMGITPIRFVKTGSNGSVCHRASIWQDGKRIAWFY